MTGNEVPGSYLMTTNMNFQPFSWKGTSVKSKAFYSRGKLRFVALVANAAAYYTHWKCMICPKMHILDVHSPHWTKLYVWVERKITTFASI